MNKTEDACHAVALEAADTYTGPFLTTDLILADKAGINFR